MKSKRSSLGLILALTLLLFSGTRLWAQEPQAVLWQPVSEQVALSPEQASALAALRKAPTTTSAVVVQVDAAALSKSETILVPLDAAHPLSLSKSGLQSFEEGSFSWFGRGAKESEQATISVSGGEMLGNLYVMGEQYTLQPLGGGAHALVHINSAGFPKDHPKGIVDGLVPEGAERATVKAEAEQSEAALPPSLGAYDYNVLVTYTAAAQAAAPSGNIALYIQQAVALANTTYVNSGASPRVTLAYSYLTNTIVESGNMETDLYRLQGIADGYVDEVHLLRNQSASDVVILLSAGGSDCGLGFVNANADFAFGQVRVDCGVANITFPHEIGHIQGARHNLQADPNDIPYAFGHGYYNTTARWRTVMSYQCPANNCTRIPYFSNPNKLYNGAPMGTVADEDNTRVLNTTGTTVALWRSPATGTTCHALTATIVGTAGNDTLTGTAGNDVIVGLAGNDTINGNGGNDVICANDGIDTVAGGDGADTIYGGQGDDILYGNAGTDRIMGDLGNDRIYAGADNDYLLGLGGNDTLSGDLGLDIADGGTESDVCTAETVIGCP